MVIKKNKSQKLTAKIKKCCQATSKTRRCQREDGKIFTFPRRFSKETCLSQPVKGFTMRSSCAPFVNCKKQKGKMKSKKNTSKRKRKQKGGKKSKNMLGSKLEICSLDPVTGYQRDGYCSPRENDMGKHLVCARMTPEFLEYNKAQGNDLSSVVSEGEKWCLCESRWLEAFQNKKAPPVIMKATSDFTNSEIQDKIKLASSINKKNINKKNTNKKNTNKKNKTKNKKRKEKRKIKI